MLDNKNMLIFKVKQFCAWESNIDMFDCLNITNYWMRAHCYCLLCWLTCNVIQIKLYSENLRGYYWCNNKPIFVSQLAIRVGLGGGILRLGKVSFCSFLFFYIMVNANVSCKRLKLCNNKRPKDERINNSFLIHKLR